MDQIEIEMNMPYISTKIKFKDKNILIEHTEYKKYEAVLYAQDLMMSYAPMLIKNSI